jgi:hypothetical protein
LTFSGNTVIECARTYVLLLLLLALCVSNAWARLDGEVEWGYAHYQQSSDSKEDVTASHFTQRYSLMYSTQGLLSNGRAGFYDIGVGAEWGAFDTRLDDEDLSNDALKFLYEGRIQIAPGGLPFRLNAYSYDLSKIQFQRSAGIQPFGPVNEILNPYRLFNPRIVTDLQNGQTIISGVQFIGGIRNGSYLGRYRESLSQWPRLLIDYRDIYRRDMESFHPQKYRDRNLAFVSLNKKDNWFHYRVYTHDDYLRPENDSRESIIMLGTIDHTLKRQWIDLTNWIRISVDGAYSEIENNWDLRKTERFDVNFFTSMQRRNFGASSLANLQRIKRGGTLENILDVPVYATRNLNPDTSVRSSFQLWRNQKMREDMTDDRNEDSYYGRVLLETRKRSRVQIDPSIEMEVHTGDVGEGEAIRGKVEAYSNRLRRQKLSWYAMSSLARFDGSSETDQETALTEGELQGGGNYALRNNMQLGGDQYLLYGTGSYGSQTTRYLHAMSAQGFDRLSSEETIADGSLLRTISTLYFEHTSPSRMRNRLQLYYKFQESDNERLNSLELSHRLNYQARLWNVSVENLYVTGDDSDYNGPGSSYLGRVVDANPYEEQFMHRNTVEFRPNNYWRSRLETSVTWGKGKSRENNLLVQVKQEVERTFYAWSAIRRKLGDVTESVIYEEFRDGVDKRAMIFSLTGNYYPTTYWRLGAGIFYHDYDFMDNVIYCSLTTGLDFPLFQVDFSYNYGATDYEKVVAHRYEMNVRKIF